MHLFLGLLLVVLVVVASNAAGFMTTKYPSTFADPAKLAKCKSACQKWTACNIIKPIPNREIFKGEPCAPPESLAPKGECSTAVCDAILKQDAEAKRKAEDLYRVGQKSPDSLTYHVARPKHLC